MRLTIRSLATLLLSVTISALPAAAHAANPATPDDQAVLAPIHALFDGMARRDAAAIQLPLLPGGSLVLMRDGKPTQMTFAAFAERVARPAATRIEERIYSPVIRIDRDLAVVWAPFDFLVDGKVDHCGTDLFNLVRVEGKWLIASVADTGHPTCSVHLAGSLPAKQKRPAGTGESFRTPQR